MQQTVRLNLEAGTIIDDRYEVRRLIGSGGAGIVYEAVQLGLGISRALKFSSPSKPERSEEFFKTFRGEVEHLSRLTHVNIIKILDYRVWRGHHYFVMEYAKGQLRDAISKINERDVLLDILEQMFHALKYIHAHEMMHGDLKPDNILYHDPGGSAKLEVKIADLGVSKFLKMVQEDFTSSNETFVWGTKIYAAPELRGRINSKELVKNQWLIENRETLDLFALGVSLAEMLSVKELKSDATHDTIDDLLDNMRQNVHMCLNQQEQRYLRRFIRKLTERDPNNRYRSIDSALSALVRITPQKMAYGAIPELTGVGCTRRIAHGNRHIQFSEAYIRWINHPAFQRLHHLNQLNFIYYVYPGARHSRFTHSIEAFDTARQATLYLLNDSAFRFFVDTEDIAHFLAASLLHDLGHYPLAHSIEDLRPKMVGDPMDLSEVRADYELVSYFLRSHFEDAPPPWNRPLWELLREDGIDPERLVKILSKDKNVSEVDAMLQTLLDGPLDIDKISYLRQDSQESSVPYGNGVDLYGLFPSLVVLLPSDYPGMITRPQVGLRSNGVSAAESIITARYHMYNRVYWHRTNRAIMAMLSYSVRKLMGTTITFKDFIDQTRDLSDWEAIRWLSNKMQAAIKNGAVTSISNRPVVDILPRITNGSRYLHKRLVTFFDHNVNPQIGTCQQFLLELDIDHIEKVRVAVLDLLSGFVDYDDITDDEVLIDIPRVRKEFDALPSELWVIDEQTGNVHSFVEYSKIAAATKEQYLSHAKRSRIFVSPRMAEQLRPNLQNVRREIIKLINSYR